MLLVEREISGNREIYSVWDRVHGTAVLPLRTTLGSRPGIHMVAGYPCRDIAWDFTEIITKPHYPGAHLISF